MIAARLLFLPLLLLLPNATVLAQAAGAPPRGEIELERMMSPEQFRKAGLGKLSAEEIRALENWLNGYVEEEATKAAEVAVEERKQAIREETTRAFGFLNIWDKNEKVPEELKGPEFIESTIPGDFRGWDGETRFELENGQVWVQQGRERYYMPLDDPRVRIEKGMFGSHFLRILDTGRRVKVERVK